MKKIRYLLFVWGLLFLSTLSNLYAGAGNFGSRNSAIRVSSGARLNQAGLLVDGTLQQDLGASITGSNIVFDGGILAQNGLEAVLAGTYSLASDTLGMLGDSTMKFEPGSVIPGVNISGVGNSLEGQPLFTSPIVMNKNSAFAIATQNALDQNITMEIGSVLTLNDNLMLADDVQITGPGTVNLNNRQLTLGGYYVSSWNTPLTFANATNISLSGDIALGASGNWTFNSAVSRINGHGATLDMSTGGKITVPASKILYLENITITGIGSHSGDGVFGNGNGGFVLGSASELHLSNVTLVFDTNITFNIGKVFIDGTTTFVLKGNTLNILGNGSLIINDTTLWLDVLSTYPDNSNLLFGASWYAYDINGYNAANVAAAISAGYLTVLNSGVIKQTVSQDVLTPDEQKLLSGNLTTTVNLYRSLNIDPSKTIRVGGNATINGNGVSLKFAQGTNPQLIIPSGVTLTLENIDLSQLRANTILFGNDAHLRLGDNVTFGLSEDLTFSSNTLGTGIAPLIRLLDGSNPPSTFVTRGLNGKQVISFVTPTATQARNQITQRPIMLGDNTICLENIECVGLDSSVLTPGVDTNPEYPAVELIGNASCDIRGKKISETNTKEQPKTSLIFYVEGENNSIVFLRDGIDFGGSVSYGDSNGNSTLPINELHLNFAIKENIQNLALARTVTSTTMNVEANYPYVTLSGNGIYVGCPIIPGNTVIANTARLEFDNHFAAVEINPTDPLNSPLQVDTGAEFYYNYLQLLGNDILQNSADVTIAGDRIDGWTFDTTGVRSMSTERQHESVAELDNETRSVVLPKSYGAKYDRPKIVNGYESLTSAFAGNLNYDASIINNFSTFNISGKTLVYPAFNLVLENNNQIFLANKSMKLNKLMKTGNTAINPATSQNININGTGNVINVTNTFTIDSTLYFAPGSSLTFNFINNSGTVVFAPNCVINLEQNATLCFQGSGRVILSNGSIVNFKGSKTVNTLTGAEVIKNKPSLILTNGAVLDFVANSTSRFAGVGNLIINNTGMIAPSTVGTLIFGNATDFLSDFDVLVSGGGEIRLDVPVIPTGSTSKTACISSQNATTSWTFNQAGMLTVGDNGLFEINASGTTLKPGRVRSISFGYNGLLFIKGSGIFSMAANQKVSLSNGMDWAGQHIAHGAELPFNWVGSQSRMGGAGTVRYVAVPSTNNYKGFSGTFNPANSTIAINDSSMNASELIRLLIT